MASALQRALEASGGGRGSAARERRDAPRRAPRRARSPRASATRRCRSPRTGSSLCSTSSFRRARRCSRCSRTGTTSTGTNAPRSSGAARTRSPSRRRGTSRRGSSPPPSPRGGACPCTTAGTSRERGSVLVEPRDVDAVVRAVAASASEAKALAPPREAPVGEGREASSGPPGPSGVEWAAAGEATSRAACLAACAANHSCQRFRFEEEEGGREAGGDARCALRVDPGQGERDGDVIGAGIYNNKCWVPGC